MANLINNMLITDETLSQISRELLGDENVHFTFTKLLIGDGTYPLTNTSTPILNHIYESPINEISRTKNNILLTATLDEDAYLIIKEIGLYCEYGDGTQHLFSLIDKLEVKKGSDLSYNLILHVKLDIGVVNTVAFPEIKIKESAYPKFKELDTVEKVYAYATENLERMIKTNALGIGSYENQIMTDSKPQGVGYDKAQVYYLFQDKVMNWEDEFCSTFSFASMKNIYNTLTNIRTTFDKSLLKTFGGAEVYDDGTGTVKPHSDLYVNEDEELVGNSERYWVDTEQNMFVSTFGDFYVDAENEVMLNTFVDRIEITNFYPIDFNSWDLKVGFKAPDNLIEDYTIINYCNDSLIQPLLLGLSNGYCFLRLGGKETLQTHLEPLNQTILFNKGTGTPVVGITRYYDWVTQSSPILNFHADFIGDLFVQNTNIGRFSTSDYATIKPFIPSTETWEINFKCFTRDMLSGTLFGTLFAFGKETANGVMGVRCTINTTINVELSFDGSTVATTLESTTEPEINTEYNIRVLFDGTKYQLYVNEIPEDTIVSSNTVYSDQTNKSYLGVDSDGTNISNPFSGEINLLNSVIVANNEAYWSGCCESNIVYTTVMEPNNLSTFYDIEGYPIDQLIFDNFFYKSILNKRLFRYSPNLDYTVKISYNNNRYIGISKVGDKEVEVLNVHSPEEIGTINNIIIGSQYDAGIGDFIAPYAGELLLDKFDLNFYRYGLNGLLEQKTQYIFIRTESNTAGCEIEDYFHIPKYQYSYFKVNNIGFDNPYSIIEVFEGYLKGQEDKIDFNNEKGYSLCIKVDIKDLNDKLILAKTNPETGKKYLTLSIKDKSIVFEHFLDSTQVDKITLSKEIETDQMIKYLSSPVTICITCDGGSAPYFRMYRNNELLVSKQAPAKTNLKANDYFLTNRLNTDDPIEEDRTVENIAGFVGNLNQSDLFYVNNLWDTNF